MSDFASLLGQLKKSADVVAATKGTKTEPNNKTGRQQQKKRQRPTTNADNDEESSNAKKRLHHRHGDEATKCSSSGRLIEVPYPKDYHQLRIKVSFLVIGAQKGGTTWLHEMLCKCTPSLSLPKQKEIHFWDWHRKKSLGWYSNQFPKIIRNHKSDDVLFGEVTPCYMALPERDVSEIHKLFPNARVIFIARDLVERAWSALLMELRNSLRGMDAGQFNATTSRAIDAHQLKKMEEEANPDLYDDNYFMERLEHTTHSSRSNYALGLKRWLRYFTKEQILILNYKDIQSKPKELLRQTLTHIGLTNDVINSFIEKKLSDDDVKQKFNVATGLTYNKQIRPSLRTKMELSLTNYAKEFNNLLTDLGGYDWKLDDYAPTNESK